MTSQEIKKQNELKIKKPLVYEKVKHYPEKATRGESIAIVRVEYSYQCNLRCEHCSIQKLREQNKKSKRILKIEDIKNIYSQADDLSLAHAVISGGEPTIFKDLDDIIKAINPQKFHIAMDSNCVNLTKQKIQHYKNIGIDRFQISLDSIDSEEHNKFRNKQGLQEKVLKVIDWCNEIELNCMVATVVGKNRVYSNELLRFLEYMKNKNVPVFITFFKPSGAAEGRYDIMTDRKDVEYIHNLRKNYNVFTHMTPAYKRSGCIAISRMITITQFGDLICCPYCHVSLGNIFETPLKDILERGMKYYRKYFETDICPIAQDKNWVEKYLERKVWGKELPVKAEKVFDD